ncbi:dehydrogenase protein [Fusarium sporotrichioides]|uniref:Dehydrogenase protein n=1 Tax=Fusarium sporotrichioides TaxID=5514 RepID=A0A395S1N5_FUSSP|nr:dehydrogenase protein [Fusarium sporotrichioides]
MSMLSAEVTEWGQTPKPVKIDPPQAPINDSETEIRVLAAGLHQLVRSRAAGKHYTATELPHRPGVDGVGVNVSTGKKVYFSLLGTTGGSYAEIVNAPTRSIVELPEGVDPVVAAAMINPVMASWMALRKRVDLKDNGFKVFINGVTTASGKIAIKVARHLGATSVVGSARNKEALSKLDLDASIVLTDTPTETDFSAAAEADIVLDFLYGPWPNAFLLSPTTAAAKNAITWINIGSLAGDGGDISAMGLRRRDVTVRGSGPGSWDPRELGAETVGMLKVLVGVGSDGLKKYKFDDVEKGWNDKGRDRVVFVFGEESKKLQ